ncbi:MFS transporter [Mumia flava]|uniref:MFS transporter n=1 Tax=Mumia flava TaxID=1348852 RepID=UPI0012FD1C1E|nr:MFS transporter [Mumia flava]
MRDRRRAYVSLVALAVAAFAFNTVEILPVGLLPEIAAGLGLSPPQAGMLVTAYALTIAVGTVPVVAASTRVRRRTVILGVVAVLTVATVVFVVVPAVGSVFGSRVATAVAHGVMWSLMGPAAVAPYPEHLRGRVLSVLATAGAAAIVGGLPAGTWLGGLLGWRVPFVVVAVLGIGSVAMLAACLDDHDDARPEIGRARSRAPDAFAFALVLVVLAASVAATFTVVTFVSLLPVDGGINGARRAAVLTTFGVSGVAAAALLGRLLDRRPRAAFALALGLQGGGLIALTAAAAWGPALWPGAALLGAAATTVPLVCQYVVYDLAPARLELALALASLAYNAGVALGAGLGSWALRTHASDALVPASLVVWTAAAAVCAVARRRTSMQAITVSLLDVPREDRAE